jgi:hypothetical protein
LLCCACFSPIFSVTWNSDIFFSSIAKYFRKL